MSMEVSNDDKVRVTSPILATYMFWPAGVTSPNLLSSNFHGHAGFGTRENTKRSAKRTIIFQTFMFFWFYLMFFGVYHQTQLSILVTSCCSQNHSNWFDESFWVEESVGVLSRPTKGKIDHYRHPILLRENQ